MCVTDTGNIVLEVSYGARTGNEQNQYIYIYTPHQCSFIYRYIFMLNFLWFIYREIKEF